MVVTGAMVAHVPLTFTAVGADGVVNVAAARAIELHSLLLRLVVDADLLGSRERPKAGAGVATGVQL